jgi:O-antigen/teichoic acid export membrane protein
VTGSLEALRAEYSRVLAFVTLFVAPAGVGISVTASPLVTVLLGEKWLAAIPLVELLGLFGAVSGVSASNGMVYLSIGRSSLVALLQASYVVVLVPTLIFATIRLGTLGAAWAVLACTLLFTAVDFALLLRVLNMGVLAVARVLWRPLLASLAMWGIVSMVDHLAGATVTTLQSFARLILLVGTGAVTYCALVTLLWLAAGRPEGAEKVLQRIIRMRLARTG